MTFGFWRLEATEALRAAAAAMRASGTVPSGHVYALAAARSDVYAQLARVTGLLVGGPPGREVPSRAAATNLLQSGPDGTCLYTGLRGTALLEQDLPPAAAEPGEAAVRMRRAADAIGVIGDILASHVTPYGRPQTQEGWQIRARGGVAGGFADIGGLAVEAIDVGRQLPGWLDGGGRHAQMDFHPLARSANWAVNSRFRDAADAVVAAGAGRLRLLNELDLSRQTLEQAGQPATVDAAVTAVDASRQWLWKHPDQIGVAHLQLVPQLGLAVHNLVDEPDSPARARWRDAPATVADLRGVPPTDTARDVAGELREVLQWLRARKVANGEVELRMRPAGFADRGDEWWARVCYALALMVELYRAAMVDNSRLQRLDERSRAADLLELANDAEVADLIAMRDLARVRLLPALPAGPVATGMTFDGSADLAADADVIVGGLLIDFKAGQGGKPAPTAPARPRSGVPTLTSCSATR